MLKMTSTEGNTEMTSTEEKTAVYFGTNSQANTLGPLPNIIDMGENFDESGHPHKYHLFTLELKEGIKGDGYLNVKLQQSSNKDWFFEDVPGETRIVDNTYEEGSKIYNTILSGTEKIKKRYLRVFKETIGNVTGGKIDSYMASKDHFSDIPMEEKQLFA